MKNKLIIGVLCSIALGSFSQNFIHNKLTISAGTSMDCLAAFDKILDEFSSSTYDNIRTESYFERANRQVMDVQFSAQYRIARKLSVEIGTSTKSYENTYGDVVYDEFTYRYSSTLYTFAHKKQSLNFGLNLFLGNSLAPLGTHIGLFYSINRFSAENVNDHYAFLQTSKTPILPGQETPSFFVHHFGLKIGSVSAISKKIPLFLNYGMTAAIPVNSFVKDKNIDLPEISSYALDVKNHSELEFFDQLVRKEYLTLYIGLGFMF